MLHLNTVIPKFPLKDPPPCLATATQNTPFSEGKLLDPMQSLTHVYTDQPKVQNIVVYQVITSVHF